jgi:hypothetical protein
MEDLIWVVESLRAAEIVAIAPGVRYHYYMNENSVLHPRAASGRSALKKKCQPAEEFLDGRIRKYGLGKYRLAWRHKLPFFGMARRKKVEL